MLRTYVVCREERERERDKQTARGTSTQCTNNSDPITSMARGSVVVKALRYKPEGRGFDNL
jgi:hypothetical protein